MRAILSVMIFAVMSTSALAEPEEGKRPKRERDPERMQKMLEKFDADGDGKLSQEERAKAREARGAKQGGQNRARGGRGMMGNPAAMFKQADTDGNGQLSQQEFTALLNKIRSARGGQRGPGAQRPRGDREGRQRGDKQPATLE